MIYPLMPLFLQSIGGGAQALGWMEGVAEAVAAAVKLGAGRASDRMPRKKPLVALGYGVSALFRPLFAVATSPAMVVLVRALDRVGKGLRDPPRDAMVAAAVGPAQRGNAFGFHRMMDNFGGALGAVLASALLYFVDLPLPTVFAASIVPGLLAVLVVLVFVREPPVVARAATDVARSNPAAPLPPAAKRWLLALALFSLAGAGDLFLINRMLELGMDRTLVPLAWLSLQLGKGLLNVAGGRASDRYGRRRVLTLAWTLYAVTYVAFGQVRSWKAAWLVLALYAFHYGLAEGGQRALLAEYVPREALGRAYGVQLALQGAMALLANVLFGVVYARLGAAAAFGAAGTAALLGAAMLQTVPAPASAWPRRASRP